VISLWQSLPYFCLMCVMHSRCSEKRRSSVRNISNKQFDVLPGTFSIFLEVLVCASARTTAARAGDLVRVCHGLQWSTLVQTQQTDASKLEIYIMQMT